MGERTDPEAGFTRPGPGGERDAREVIGDYPGAELLRVVSVSRIEDLGLVPLESVTCLRPGDRFLLTVEGVY